MTTSELHDSGSAAFSGPMVTASTAGRPTRLAS